ncbi:MAG: tubulin-like doman-containing protein [Nitrososphaeria archaeon]
MILIVFSFLMWYLTREFLRKENIILYADIIFTIIWSVASTTSFSTSFNIPLFGLFGMIFYYIFLGFVGLTALLAMISWLLFIKNFLIFRKERNDYESVNNLYGTYKDKYSSAMNNIERIKTNLTEMMREIDDALRKLDDAKRAPENIITSRNEIPVGEIVPSRKNVVIIGLGGTGTGIVTGLGLPGGEKSYLKDSILNNLISRNVIRDGNEPFLFILYDTNDENITQIKNKFSNTANASKGGINFLNMIKAFSYPTVLNTTSITTSNPYLVGTDVSMWDGTGNRRALGYAAYNVVKAQLLNDVKNSINELLNRSRLQNTLIFVINSWGGGTGSGTFLKFTMDLKEKLSEIPQLHTNPPDIYGFGILPAAQEGDIFKANAYGALKEMTYMMRPIEQRFGDVERRIFSNPFTGYLLVSRDTTNSQRDTDLASGISNFIFDLITVIKEEGSTVAFDPTDISTRFQTYSRQNFGSLEFYTIMFPASQLSWYKVYGEPKMNRLKIDLQKAIAEKNEQKENIETLKSRRLKLLEDLNSLRDSLTEFTSQDPYKSFKDKIRDWSRDVGLKIIDIDARGTYDINTLDNEISNLETSSSETLNIPEVERNIGKFVETVNGVGNYLRNPVNTDIFYSFSVDPDMFVEPEEVGGGKLSIGILNDREMNMVRLMQRMGRQDSLLDAYNSLKKPLGQAGQLLHLNFRNMNLPMNLRQSEINFIMMNNPQLIRDQTNMVVSRPRIKDLILLTSSNPQVYTTNFPQEDALMNPILSSVEQIEYRASKLPYRKYSIVMYRIYLGVPIMQYSPDEESMLPLVDEYSKAYKKEYAGNRDKFFIHHAALYDIGINELNLLGIQVGQNENRRDMITKFWVDYDPIVGEEYSRRMYVTLGMAKINSLIELIKNISEDQFFLSNLGSLSPNSMSITTIGTWDDTISSMNGKVQSGINTVESIKAIIERMKRIYSVSEEDFKVMMNRMKQEIADNFDLTGKSLESFDSLIEEVVKKISEANEQLSKEKETGIVRQSETTKRKLVELKNSTDSLFKRISKDIISPLFEG